MSDTEICLDLRGLAPPEPLERVLDALDRMPPGGIRIRIDREPVPLYRILERNGYRYDIHPLADGEFDIVVIRQG